MAESTGIEWTDSTWNPWEGCTKVGPGCDHCYAEARNVRFSAGSNWGVGAPRRHTSAHIWNDPMRWQRDADAFELANKHPRRVFVASLADIFDNAVPEEWQADAFRLMQDCDRLRWLPLTKRVGNVETFVPNHWKAGFWPGHVGLMITVVTAREVARDVPKLLDLKRRLAIPWVGLSIEPLIEDVADALRRAMRDEHVDWMIVGGESGRGARRYEMNWPRHVIELGAALNIAVFHKQLGERPTLKGDVYPATGKGKDMREWPEGLRVRQFPRALQ